MTYNLIITPEAHQEESDAYNYYENIRVGLGEEFLLTLEKHYYQIAENPQYFSFVNNAKMLRDVQIERFPFIIVYFVADNDVIIVSVRNAYRRPYI